MIENFVRDFIEKNGLPKYIYNGRNKSFVPGVDSVYYGGPLWDEDELIAMTKSIFEGDWIVSGEKVTRFEIEFSRRIKLGYSLMVNSGSSANLIMIAALKKHLGWVDKSEIIVSPVGFPTTISPIIQNNLIPIFADITYEDLNFSLYEVEKKITSNTKAIFVSPVLGNPPNIDLLIEIAQKHNIKLILDGCDSLGSTWNNKQIYEYFYASSCSFYPAHHITTGEGGMVSSNDEKLIDLARSFAWWGRDCYCNGKANLLSNGTCKKRFSCWIEKVGVQIDHKYYFTNIGYNLKPLDLQGAIGSVQLKRLDFIHEKRRKLKTRFEELLIKIPGVRVISEQNNKSNSSWFGVPIVCESPDLKIKLVSYFETNKIQTRNYFAGNILLHPAYIEFGDPDSFPNASKVLKDVFFIGCSPSLNDDAIKYVEERIISFKA